MNGDDDDIIPEGAENALAPPDDEVMDDEAGGDGDEAEGEAEGGREAPEAQASEPVDPEAETLARELGWKPLSEWRGDTSGWVDLDRFMELPGTLRKVNQRMAKDLAEVKAATTQAMRDQRARMEAEKKAEIDRIRKDMRSAVEVGDTDRYDQLEAERERIAAAQPTAEPEQPQENPVVAEFKSRNEWAKDPVKWGQAYNAVNLGLAIGAVPPNDPAAQLAYAERSLRETHPHWFQSAPQPRRPSVQRVDGGSPLGGSKPKANTWDSIPEGDRKDLSGLVGSVFKDKSEAAKYYWEDNS